MTREKSIEPAAGVAQLILEDDSVVVEVRVVDQKGKRCERVLPRVDFCPAGLVTDLGYVLDTHFLGNTMQPRIGQELFCRAGV